MLLPISDSNPRHRISFQYVTVALITACVAVFLWQASLDPRSAQEAVYALGTIPAVVFGERTLSPELSWIPAEMTLLTSMFMHGGWMHLIGNMLYLWILGDNVEDCMGHVRFLIFYLVCGLAAVGTHMLIDTGSTVPLVGASGAISGVMGGLFAVASHGADQRADLGPHLRARCARAGGHRLGRLDRPAIRQCRSLPRNRRRRRLLGAHRRGRRRHGPGPLFQTPGRAAAGRRRRPAPAPVGLGQPENPFAPARNPAGAAALALGAMY
tara:strand:+ start:57989 stop:58792 length:804 start_codon:yes stop_codon:yes gene_type:complete